MINYINFAEHNGPWTIFYEILTLPILLIYYRTIIPYLSRILRPNTSDKLYSSNNNIFRINCFAFIFATILYFLMSSKQNHSTGFLCHTLIPNQNTACYEYELKSPIMIVKVDISYLISTKLQIFLFQGNSLVFKWTSGPFENIIPVRSRIFKLTSFSTVLVKKITKLTDRT